MANGEHPQYAARQRALNASLKPKKEKKPKNPAPAPAQSMTGQEHTNPSGPKGWPKGTGSWAKSLDEAFSDLQKAGIRKKPFGHKQYSRKSKSGKVIVIQAKGSPNRPTIRQFATELRKMGFKADEDQFPEVRSYTKIMKHRDPKLSRHKVNEIEINVQLWRDGAHRVSFMRNGSHWVAPTDFNSMKQMYAAIEDQTQKAKTTRYKTFQAGGKKYRGYY